VAAVAMSSLPLVVLSGSALAAAEAAAAPVAAAVAVVVGSLPSPASAEGATPSLGWRCPGPLSWPDAFPLRWLWLPLGELCDIWYMS